MDDSINIAASSVAGRESRNRGTAWKGSGRSATHVPKLFRQKWRDLVETWDTDPGARAGHLSRTLTRCDVDNEWGLRNVNLWSIESHAGPDLQSYALVARATDARDHEKQLDRKFE